jgi:TM2 domain-containing membrane protein YozV
MEQQAEKTTHSIVTGYLLWIFGFTGAHRFCHGRQISGIIWLFTLGLFGIGYIYDYLTLNGQIDECNAAAGAG